MRDLKQVLIGISDRMEKAGGAVSRQTKLALRSHRKRKLVTAIVLTVFIMCCLALSAYLLLEKRSQESREFATLSGVGGAGGALEALRRVWKDCSRTDLLLILIEDASEDQVAELIDKLIKGL